MHHGAAGLAQKQMLGVELLEGFVQPRGVALHLADEAAAAELILEDGVGADGGETELGAEEIAGFHGGGQIFFKVRGG